jgi:hypothetical protein
VELLSGGRTIPGAAFGVVRPGADNLLLRPEPLLIAVAVLHAWLLFNLLLGAAVETDGRVVPARWCRMAVGITLAIVVGCDALLPVGIGIEEPAWMSRGPGRGLGIAVCGLACGALLGVSSTPAGRQGLMLGGAILGWQAAVCIALLRPVFGWLRGLFASLVPPDAPAGYADSTELTTGEFSESIRGVLASPEEEPSSSIHSGSSPLPEPGSVAVSRPETAGDRRPSFSRLIEPIARYLQRRELPGGDLMVATVAFLLAWRWLWQLVAE